MCSSYLSLLLCVSVSPEEYRNNGLYWEMFERLGSLRLRTAGVHGWLQVAAIETAVSKQTSSLPQRVNFNIITLTSGERRSSGLWALLFTSSWPSTGFFLCVQPVPREVSATTHAHRLSTWAGAGAGVFGDLSVPIGSSATEQYSASAVRGCRVLLESDGGSGVFHGLSDLLLITGQGISCQTSSVPWLI